MMRLRLGLILCAFGWHRWRDNGDGSGDYCLRRCNAHRAWYQRPRWRGATDAELEAEFQRTNPASRF